MTLDEEIIAQNIRKVLNKEIKLNPTKLHRQVFDLGRGNYGETVVWNTMRNMVKNGEIEEEILENRRKIYRLRDISADVAKSLDLFFKDLEKIKTALDEFHKKYSNKKDQTQTNYLIRLSQLTHICRTLAKSQSSIMLFKGFPAFTKHKSWKALERMIDEIGVSIRANAFHQLGNNGKFYQELIFSVQ